MRHIPFSCLLLDCLLLALAIASLQSKLEACRLWKSEGAERS